MTELAADGVCCSVQIVPLELRHLTTRRGPSMPPQLRQARHFGCIREDDNDPHQPRSIDHGLHVGADCTGASPTQDRRHRQFGAAPATGDN